MCRSSVNGSDEMVRGSQTPILRRCVSVFEDRQQCSEFRLTLPLQMSPSVFQFSSVISRISPLCLPPPDFANLLFLSFRSLIRSFLASLSFNNAFLSISVSLPDASLPIRKLISSEVMIPLLTFVRLVFTCPRMTFWPERS